MLFGPPTKLMLETRVVELLLADRAKSRKSQQKRAFKSRGTGGGNGPRGPNIDMDEVKDALKRISRDLGDPTVVQAAAEAVAAAAGEDAAEAAEASQSLLDVFQSF